MPHIHPSHTLPCPPAFCLSPLQVAKGGQGSLLLDGFRRYELSWVQRRVAGQAGLPRAYLQADLDFILPAARTPAEGLLGEAEVGGAVWGMRAPGGGGDVWGKEGRQVVEALLGEALLG